MVVLTDQGDRVQKTAEPSFPSVEVTRFDGPNLYRPLQSC
jgi:hypothetical protein